MITEQPVRYVILNLSQLPPKWVYMLATSKIAQKERSGHALGRNLFPNDEPYRVRVRVLDDEIPRYLTQRIISSMCGGSHISLDCDTELWEHMIRGSYHSDDPIPCVTVPGDIDSLDPDCESSIWYTEDPEDYTEEPFTEFSVGIIRHVVPACDTIRADVWHDVLKKAWEWKQNHPWIDWTALHGDLSCDMESEISYSTACCRALDNTRTVVSVLQVDAIDARELRTADCDPFEDGPEECPHCGCCNIEYIEDGEWWCEDCEQYFNEDGYGGCADDVDLTSCPDSVMMNRSMQQAKLASISDPVQFANCSLSGEWNPELGNLYNLKRVDMQERIQREAERIYRLVSHLDEEDRVTGMVCAFNGSEEREGTYSSPLLMVMEHLMESKTGSFIVSSNVGDPYVFRYTTALMWWMLDHEDELEDKGIGLLYTDQMASNPNENYHFIHSVTPYVKNKETLRQQLQKERVLTRVKEHLDTSKVVENWIYEQEENRCAA